MNRIKCFRCALCIIATILYSFQLNAQKPVIDSSAIEAWTYADNIQITPNGVYASYVVTNEPKGYGTIHVSSLSQAWEKTYSKVLISRMKLSGDSGWLGFLTMSDTLVINKLGTNIDYRICNVKSFQFVNLDNTQYIIYLTDSTRSDLIIENLTTQSIHLYKDVQSYIAEDSSDFIVMEGSVSNADSSFDRLQILNVRTNFLREIFSGNSIQNLIISATGEKIAFLANETAKPNANKSIFCYSLINGKLSKIVTTQENIYNGSLLISSLLKFNNSGDNIFINLSAAKQDSDNKNLPAPDIWSYKEPKLHSLQMKEIGAQQFYKASVNLKTGEIFRLEYSGEYVFDFNVQKDRDDDHFLVIDDRNDTKESNWNPNAFSTCTIVSVKEKSRTRIPIPIDTANIFYYRISPKGKFVIWYDPSGNSYYALTIQSGRVVKITQNIHADWSSWRQSDLPKGAIFSTPAGIGAWTYNDSSLLLYDRFDIYEVDPTGRNPAKSLTEDFGKRHNYVLRLALGMNSPLIIKNGETIILNVFDRTRKRDGFLSIEYGKRSNVKLLTLDDCIYKGPGESEFDNYFAPVKSTDSNVFIIRKMTATHSPNFYWTRDFANFHAISDVHPENSYNWLTTQLVTWKETDGNQADGILYKPQDFDSSKKYPVIIYYYEKLSEGLNAFLSPDFCEGPINIPYFVSNGYLVFTPDISFKVGEPGNSVVNSVVSSANYLSTLPFVNRSKIGIQGHSRGGFETNYLVTHSTIFAAASSACGFSDYVSLYLGVNSYGLSRSAGFERSFQRIGYTLWERPDLYIKNSPIFSANKVTTPILILANNNDPDVPFQQGLEFFMALRRLRKKAWLIQYDNEEHLLSSYDAQRDYTKRLFQFFNFYLKDNCPAKWMIDGVLAHEKGVNSGLDLDCSGKTP